MVPKRHRKWATILLLFLISICSIRTLRSLTIWAHDDGGRIAGELVNFDRDQRLAVFRDPISKKVMPISPRDLSLGSRQRLLIDSVEFRRASDDDADYEDEDDVYTREVRDRRGALWIAALIGIAVTCVGFWLVGGLFARKWNLLFAAGACLGSWVMMAILMFCYAFLRARINGGMGILLVGGAVSLGVTPMLISAIYACSYWKGHLILLTHLLAALCVLGLAETASNVIIGQDRADAWWNEAIFEPAGIIQPLVQTERLVPSATANEVLPQR